MKLRKALRIIYTDRTYRILSATQSSTSHALELKNGENFSSHSASSTPSCKKEDRSDPWDGTSHTNLMKVTWEYVLCNFRYVFTASKTKDEVTLDENIWNRFAYNSFSKEWGTIDSCCFIEFYLLLLFEINIAGDILHNSTYSTIIQIINYPNDLWKLVRLIESLLYNASPVLIANDVPYLLLLDVPLRIRGDTYRRIDIFGGRM